MIFLHSFEKINALLYYLTACLCLSLISSACILNGQALQKTLSSEKLNPTRPLEEPVSEHPETQAPEPPEKPVSDEENSSLINIKPLRTVSEKTYGRPEIRFKSTPKLPSAPVKRQKDRKEKPGKFSGKPLTVNIDAMPLPAFINEAYGNILGTSFEIDSALRNKKDLVTLRMEQPVSPSDFDALARHVLSNYGVIVEHQGKLMRFVAGKGAAVGEPPLLVSGRTLPQVPISHRPVFQMISLEVVRNVHVAGWLKQAYKGQELNIFEDPERNAVLLMGVPSIVRQAADAVRVLDQPYMRGRHSVRIEPAFLNARELSKLLLDVLNSEGYSATMKPPMGSIIVLPVKAVNAVLVFAADAGILEHVREWANILDRPSQNIEGQDGFFYYQVRNTRAAELAKMLEKLMTGMTMTPGKSSEQNKQQNAKLVVDEARNGLLFQGDFYAWEQLLPVIREMDRPARMVLIEVTVAEITLSDQEELGMEWIFNNISTGNVTGVLGTLGGLDIGSKGLSYILDNAGQTRAMINAFAANSRVNILSTPRVMVKSGGKATIDVGTEVPIITSQSSASDLQASGSPSVLQEIQYRKTGILLNVSPVVHSGNRIDLDITQEVSESKPNTTTNISSPNIFTRKISTSLGLRDGGSVLLGGLISSSSNKGYSGMPVLSEIPYLGRLFRVERNNNDRTELIMLIVPYVIDSSQDAEAVTKTFQKQLSRVSEGG